MLDSFHVGVAEVPVIVCAGGHVLKNPSLEGLAEKLGLAGTFDSTEVHDVIIVGAGPAGLAAAVYGASEGLRVLVLDSTAAGGQAGTSSRIENYLGFPTGISGQALAGRARTQAEKFGAEIAVGRNVVRLDCDSRPYRIFLADGQELRTRTIVVASGVQYRRLDLPMLGRFEGVGIFYSATHLEGQLCHRGRGGRRRRGKLRRPGRRVPLAARLARSRPGAWAWPGREHVPLSDRAHRLEPQHHAADPPFDR